MYMQVFVGYIDEICNSLLLEESACIIVLDANLFQSYSLRSSHTTQDLFLDILTMISC